MLAYLAMTLRPLPTLADVLSPRETADVGAKGSYSLGLFNPLRWALWDGVEVEAHPLVFISAPHVTARVRHLDANGWRIAGEYGFGLPVFAWTRARPLGVSGDLVPSCKVADDDAKASRWCDRPGWILVPSLGVAISKGFQDAAGAERGIATLRFDVSKGFTVAGHAGAPLAAWAPVDVQLAPWIGQGRGRLRLGYDHAVVDGLRLRGEAGLHYTTQADDDDRSPWTASLYAGVDVRTSTHTRLTLGAMYWNSDMHGITIMRDSEGYATVQRVRNHEVWPTFDVIWTY